MRDLPSGVVTFVFTDIEGSTGFLRELGAESYAEALAQHRQLVIGEATRCGGFEVDTQGDAFFLAFANARRAVEAAQAITAGLSSGPIRLLPDEPTSPMADRQASTKVDELAQAAAHPVCLSDVDHVAAVHPAALQDSDRHRRVLPLEPAGRACLEEGRRSVELAQRDIDTRGIRYEARASRWSSATATNPSKPALSSTARVNVMSLEA